MPYYYVFVWAAAGQQWTPIKRFARPIRRGLIVDPSERLTYKQAQQRLERLEAGHPMMRCKIDRI